jgi:predicted  nucleic acid-binding Zn-ribbon protein
MRRSENDQQISNYMTVDQQFTTLNDKLQQLLKQYNRLQKENERLKEELQQSRKKETDIQHRIDELQQQVSILKLGSGELSEKDKKEFEKKINQYIREIDKCISFLSQ